MPLKTLIILALIAIISVGMAFVVVTKGYIPLGKTKDETVASQDETAEGEQAGEGESVEGEDADNPVSKVSNKLPDIDVIPLDPIVVNLRGSFGRRYLRVGVNLGMEKVAGDEEESGKKKDEEKDEGEEKVLSVKEIVEGKLVEIRDVLISLLSAKSIEDVDGWADQDMIRNEIREVLNKELKLDKGISKVFFTEFVVQ
ncbi:MAG: flagellar basal body-associated FliL family protein [Candidatus Anammoxibacter sp.]